jgi:gamma-glutamyltranspeptidase/glutathione hydrolase
MDDGGVVHLEDGFSDDVRKKLESMGHRLGPSNGSFGGYQAIYVDADEGVYYGASEVRKDGHAAGY